MMYHKSVETMPRAELEQMQIERLQATLNRVYRSVAFYKAAFDSALQTMQEQNEKMFSMCLEQATWLPLQQKMSINEWIKAIHVVEKQILSMPIAMLTAGQ